MDVNTTLQPTASENTRYSSTESSFTKMDDFLSHKTCFIVFQRTDDTQSLSLTSEQLENSHNSNNNKSRAVNSAGTNERSSQR